MTATTIRPPGLPETTPANVERVRRLWVQYAGEGEAVVVECISGTLYGFCSELAAYRIERKYNCRPKCEAFFSKPRGSWCVRLERTFSEQPKV